MYQGSFGLNVPYSYENFLAWHKDVLSKKECKDSLLT